jgi:hypothetical protein
MNNIAFMFFVNTSRLYADGMVFKGLILFPFYTAKEDMQKAAIVHQNNIAKRAYPKGRLCCQESTEASKIIFIFQQVINICLNFFAKSGFIIIRPQKRGWGISPPAKRN